MSNYKQVVTIGIGFVFGAVLSGYFVKQLYCATPDKQHNHSVIPSSITIQNALGKSSIIDVAIIGSGPAGLSSALYTSRLGRKTVVIQGNNQGGQLMGTSDVENWPGVERIKGPDLIAGLQRQAESFGPMFLADSVERIDFKQWPYQIHTENGLIINALSVIVATGASPRKLVKPGEQEYWGRGVTTCAICDAPFYKGEDVVVVGGGDSAVEEAIQLAPYVKKVTMLVRGTKMRATPVMQKRIDGYPNIEVRYNLAIEAIKGDGVHVTGIDLINTESGEMSSMNISGVFLAIGHEPNSQIFNDALECTESGYIIMQGRSQATSLAGIFAAGDVEDDVYRQGGVAAGNGIKAAIDADRFLASVGLDKQMVEKLQSEYLVLEQGGSVEIPVLTSLKEYQAVLANHDGVIVLDFYTESCSSCLQMLPALAAIAEEYSDTASFYKIDAEQATDLVEKFLVYKVPCIIVVKNGALVARYNEAKSKKELSDIVQKFL